MRPSVRMALRASIITALIIGGLAFWIVKPFERQAKAPQVTVQSYRPVEPAVKGQIPLAAERVAPVFRAIRPPEPEKKSVIDLILDSVDRIVGSAAGLAGLYMVLIEIRKKQAAKRKPAAAHTHH